MNLKENMEAIGNELSSEERFFESAIRTERFIKRYKKPLIVSVASLILFSLGAIGYQAYHDMKVKSANTALVALLMNPSDTQAAKTLQSDNHELYELYQLSKAVKESNTEELNVLQKSSITEVADIAAYESAVLKNDTAALEAYTKRQNALYHEMALVVLAVDGMEKGDTKAANEKLALIKEDSSVYPIALALSHYGVK